ncbi:MAG: hypothetical protein HY922_08815 [Elusimicrobia bacterium]|nr:hypothetical protein [Elusimicrobiota bacterium]
MLLSLSLAASAYGQQAAPDQPAAVGASLPPLTVTAPRLDDAQARALKSTRAAGAAVGVGGAAVAVAGGIIGAGAFVVTWGAAALFAGGMSAYLAHRRLKGM